MNGKEVRFGQNGVEREIMDLHEVNIIKLEV